MSSDSSERAYCLKCGDFKEVLNSCIKTTKNNRQRLSGTCKECGKEISQFKKSPETSESSGSETGTPSPKPKKKAVKSSPKPAKATKRKRTESSDESSESPKKKRKSAKKSVKIAAQ